jgi:L-seryl-tRNA(Ser) seleniumtransferase
MRKNPLCRALRVDKVTLAGLEATLRLYRDPQRALREIPALRMLGEPQESVRERARRGAGDLRSAGFVEDGLVVEDAPGASVVGGGTYPEVEIPSWTIRIRGEGISMTDFAASLRAGDPPVVGRVEDDALVLDLRTVNPEEEVELIRRLLETAAGE